MQSMIPIRRLVIGLAVVLGATALVSCASDVTSPAPLAFRAAGEIALSAVTSEGSQLECPEGSVGEYPECNTDPCYINPGAPGCADYCYYSPSDPICWQPSPPCEVDCGGGAPPTPTDTVCTTPLDNLLTQANVQAGMKEIWRRSNYMVNGAIQPFNTRIETGFFVRQEPAGNMVIDYFPMSWSQGPCGINPPAGFMPPAGTVAWFHTHPFKKGEQMPGEACGALNIGGQLVPQNYTGESSTEDELAMTEWGKQGYLIDADHIGRIVVGGVSDTHFSRCGY
jgi:hypothetical protein